VWDTGSYSLSGASCDSYPYNVPPGVQLIMFPKWFPEAFYAISIPPRGSVSLVAVSAFGYPNKVLACTQLGCTALEGIAMVELPGSGTSYWILCSQPDKPCTSIGPPPPNATLLKRSNIEWLAYRLGWQTYDCTAPYALHQTIRSCGTSIVCCYGCAAVTTSGQVLLQQDSYYCQPTIFKAIRGVCSQQRGSLTSTWLQNAPPTVYALIRNVGRFYLPTAVTINGVNYRLYGLNNYNEDQNVPAWDALGSGGRDLD